MDPIMVMLSSAVLAILVIGFLIHRLKQPYVVGYIIVGIILGPHGLALISDQLDLSRIGSIGVLLLLFFIGMEISLPRLVANWRVAVIGTLLQILISVGILYGLGYWLNWPLAQSILLGFMISLSSTAVVIKILQEWKEIDTDVGGDVIGILLVQDLAIVPMMISINFLGGAVLNITELILQIVGGLGIIALLIWVVIKREFKMPFGHLLRKDNELQVFSAFMLCFGLAFITGMLNLSAAVGAFVAGILISAAKETTWVYERLEPFHVVFVAFFFVSIGMLVDLNFLRDNLILALTLVILAVLINTAVNAVIMRFLREDWRSSLYGGALLSQIGEFSFVLAGVGIEAAIITEFSYQMTIAVISLTLLLSPLWILSIKRFTRRKPQKERNGTRTFLPQVPVLSLLKSDQGLRLK
jgi:CPA2 family monovalent cation:H+ antiporter-2